MAEKSTAGSSAGVPSRVSARDDYETFRPMHVGSENAVEPESVRKVWAKMMSDAGLRNPSEDEQKSFRLAVYVYGAKNGTSRDGNYERNITMSTGHTFPSAVIPRATGTMSIRKFYRGNVVDSYELLKKSRAMEYEEGFIAKAADFGVSAEVAFAAADWFDGCALLTPVEKRAHAARFNTAIERARRARGGHTLEEVEDARVDERLMAQGPAVAEVSGKSVW